MEHFNIKKAISNSSLTNSFLAFTLKVPHFTFETLKTFLFYNYFIKI